MDEPCDKRPRDERPVDAVVERLRQRRRNSRTKGARPGLLMWCCARFCSTRVRSSSYQCLLVQ